MILFSSELELIQENKIIMSKLIIDVAGEKIFLMIITDSDIYNITNGERLSTYAIVGPPASGSICVNGAACHKAKKGDKIIICTYAELESSEISNHSPKIIHVDDENRIIPKKVNQKLNIQNG